MTLSDLQGHSPVAGLYKWDLFIYYKIVHELQKIKTSKDTVVQQVTRFQLT